MKNEILEIIGNLTKDQVKKFRYLDDKNDLSLTSRLVKEFFQEFGTVEQVASRLCISLERQSTTLEKIKKYVDQELAVSNRKLMTFRNLNEANAFRLENKNCGSLFFDSNKNPAFYIY